METDKYTYNRILLEKAFERYGNGIRSVQKQASIFQERADVEKKYALGLRQWAKKTAYTITQPDFETCDAIINLFHGAVKEAEERSQNHSLLYAAFQDAKGPFEKLNSMKKTRDARIGNTINMNQLIEDFKKAKEQTRALESCFNEWCRARDRYSVELKKLAEIDLPSDLGMDTERESLNREKIRVKAQIENAKIKLASVSKRFQEHKDFHATDFKEMDANLNTVEMDRISETVNALKRYQRILSASEDMKWRQSMVDRITELRQDAMAVRPDRIVTEWKKDAEEALKTSLVHPTKSFMSILFDHNPSLRPPREEFGSDMGPRLLPRAVAPRYCESLTSRPESRQMTAEFRQLASTLDALGKECSVMRAFYSPSSSAESLVEAPVKSSRNGRVTTVHVNPAVEAFENSSISDLEDSMDSIPILSSTVCTSPPARPTIFCPEEESSDEDDGPPVLSKATANFSLANQMFSSMDNIYTSSMGERTVDVDVSRFVNTKVRANRNYRSREDGMLSFKVGQVIKQKLAKNDQGLCYGWTRSGRFSMKRYGFYPAEHVSPF